MKKLAVLLIAALLSLSLAACSEGITHDRNGTGSITYTYGSISFTEELSSAEVSQVVDILDGKLEVSLAPDCGFTQMISITIGAYTYCVAPDGCGALVNITTAGCITLSEAEQDVLEAMFTSRGGTFPYV